jgi:hypothetical protein
MVARRRGPALISGTLTTTVGAMVRRAMTVAAAVVLLAGCGSSQPTREPAATAAPTPDAADLNREAKAPAIVRVYKTIGDDPYPWTLTVRTDDTANLIVGGGHGGGDDKLVRLEPAVTRRTARLVDAVPWQKVEGHTVEPGGFGGNDNMARYVLTRGKLSTVYAAGDMPSSISRLVRLLDKMIDEDIGTIVASDRHYSANGGVLDEP